MYPGAWSVFVVAHRLPPAVLAALALAIVTAGTLLVLALAAAAPPAAGTPAQDLLLAPFRWAPLAERGLA